MFTRLLPIILLIASVCVGNLFAQSGTGSISGVVSDTTGAVVKGATVTLTSKATNQSQTATTNDDGLYGFVLLQPGTYTAKTTAGSFGAVSLDVTVQVGRTTDANVTLGAAGVSAVVEVTAEGIQTTTNNFDTIQNEAAIQNLPINGRRFQDFVTLTPNAQVGLGGDTRNQISLSGQRGINSNVNVDGVDYNQPFFGGIRGGERSASAPTLPQESVREFQVVAAGYSAEFGRSSGGIVNAVTKSGTNDVRGTLFYLFRPAKLARANAFAKELAFQRLNALGITATLAPTQHQFGGSIGGPIVKEKLFYFGSYEQQRFRAPRFVLFNNLVGVAAPTNAGQAATFSFYRGLEVPYKQTNDAIALLGKVDWNITDTNRLSIRYNHARNKAINGVATGENALDPTTNNSLPTNGTEENRNNIFVGSLTSSISASWSNEFRGQFAREVRPRTANAIVANINNANGIYGTRNFLPTTQFDRRIQFGDNITYINGSHTAKFGGEYSNILADQKFGFNQTGVWSFSGLTTNSNSSVPVTAGQNCSTAGVVCVANSPVGTPGILQALGTERYAFVASATSNVGALPFLGRFDTQSSRLTQQVGNLLAAFTIKELSFFGTDSWRIRPNFTLTYGLRYERQFNPSAVANNTPILNLVRNTVFPVLGKTIDPAVIPDSQHEWAPRLGFAWDPRRDGKTVIRAYAGRYFARTPGLVFAGPFNNFRDPAGDLSVTLGSPAFLGTTPTATTASTFNFPAFFAANPNYATVTGLTAAQCATAGQAFGPTGNNTGNTNLFNSCSPNTVYRQFAILGINLNNSSLSNLPTLTTTQLTTISNAIAGSISPTPVNLGIYQGASFTGMTSDFRNPQSFQFGGGVEHEMWKDIILGLDFSYVNTVYLQRNRDVNLPAPTSVDPVSGRVIVNRNLTGAQARPITSVGTIQIRDSSARSVYRALTFRINMAKKWGRVNAFYTLARSTSDDDNERDAGGVLYSNPYDLTTEYYNSRIDRRHQFVASPLFYLPFGVEITSAIRLRSGQPVNSLVGSDLNSDGNTTERPIIVPGVELPRNYYTNRALFDVDLRAQKGFKFGETRRLVFSAEFFNVFNRSNVQFAGSATTNFCNNTAANCGLSGISNINFLNIIQQTPTATNFGRLNLAGLNPGSQVFQMQLGARFQF